MDTRGEAWRLISSLVRGVSGVYYELDSVMIDCSFAASQLQQQKSVGARQQSLNLSSLEMYSILRDEYDTGANQAAKAYEAERRGLRQTALSGSLWLSGSLDELGRSALQSQSSGSTSPVYTHLPRTQQITRSGD